MSRQVDSKSELFHLVKVVEKHGDVPIHLDSTSLPNIEGTELLPKLNSHKNVCCVGHMKCCSEMIQLYIFMETKIYLHIF